MIGGRAPLCWLAAALWIGGCGDDSAHDGSGGAGGNEPMVGGGPDFSGGRGQEAQSEAPYPEGPYGSDVGSTIPNLELFGFIDPSRGTELELIHLSDFYNPTGDGSYPEGSPWGAGRAKPVALLLNQSASWCQPCIAESRYEFPPRYAAYRFQGGEFLSVLVQGPDFEPAGISELVNWVGSVDAVYPSALDPTAKLASFFPANAFPGNAIIDTRTMEIVRYGAVVDEAFWAAFEEILGVESMSCFVLDQSGCAADEACDLSDVTGMFFCRPADSAGVQGEPCPGGDASACAAGYWCSSSEVCEAFCTDSSTCGPSEDCVAIVTGIGACEREPCTILDQENCEPSEACDVDMTGDTYCRQAGSGVQGDSCLAGGNPEPTLCDSGYRCSAEGVCEAFCDLSSQCPNGDQCEALSGNLGVCVTPPCTILPQAGCPGAQACDIDVSAGSYCRNASTGTQGSPCYLGGNPVPAVCAAGFSCSQNQVCEALCVDASTCGGLSCNPLFFGFGLCE